MISNPRSAADFQAVVDLINKSATPAMVAAQDAVAEEMLCEAPTEQHLGAHLDMLGLGGARFDKVLAENLAVTEFRGWNNQHA